MLSLCLALLEEDEDKKRFEELYQKYRGYMCKIALSVADNEVAAMDSVQDAFIAIAKNIDHIPKKGAESERRYIRKVILSKLSNTKRKDDKIVKVDELREKIISDVDYGDIDDSTMEVLSILKTLPATYVDTLTFYYIDEIKPHDIAAMLGISPFTVYSRINRGTAMMKRRMEGTKNNG